MATSSVSKLYQLKTIGYADLHKQLEQIGKDFEVIKKAKLAAEQGVQNATTTQQLAEYKKQLQDIKLEEARLSQQSKQLAADLKAQQLQRKAQIDQLKDQTALDKALMQQQQQSAKAAATGLNAQTGSYAALVRQAKEFYALLKVANPTSTITYNGTAFSYQQAIDEYKRLSEAEQAFRRQFTQDSLLVGEYTSGIVQAFKRMGLSDLVAGQVNSANAKFQTLVTELTVLKNVLGEIKNNGSNGLSTLLNTLANMRAAGQETTQQFQTLDRILRESGGDTTKIFQLLEQALVRDTHEAQQLRKEINTINAEMRGVGDIGEQVTRGIADGFKNLKGQVAQFALSFFGIQAALNAIIGQFNAVKQLTDQYEDLRRVLGATQQEFAGIREEVKGIDTRTNLNDLFDISIIAAKAGVAKDSIAGVTKAIDALKQVAGNELGDVDTATTSIVKLINIFDGPGQVTEENVLKFGNALVELANAGVASGEFLVDFGKRLAGIQGITGISIKSVLGLAAGFEELGQSSEVAGTAVTQILSKVGADVEKYAAIARKPVEAFREVLRTNPAEALLQLAEGLKGDSKAFDEIAPKFKELEARGVRVQSIFGTMADNADFFREKISLAGNALENTDSIMEGAQAKQEDFAGTVDKIGKAFSTAFSNQNFLNVLQGLADVLLTITRIITAIPFSLLIGGLTLATAAWAAYRGGLRLARLEQDANNTSTLLGYVRINLMKTGLFGATAAEKARTLSVQQTTNAIAAKIAALEEELVFERESLAVLEAKVAANEQEAIAIQAAVAAKRAKILATEAEITVTEAATIATEELNVATKFSPLGALLSILLILVPSMVAYASMLDKSADGTKKLATATGDAVKDYNALSKEVNNLEKNITPLLGKYDDLQKKTSLSTDEQNELKGIIQQVAAAMPGAITAYDKLGNAIAISTQRVRDYIDAEKARLKVVNADAIEEYNKKLKGTSIELTNQQRIIDQITKTGTFTVAETTSAGVSGGGVSTIIRKASQEEVQEAQKKYKDLLELKKGYNAEIGQLTGQQLEDVNKQVQNDATTKTVEKKYDIDLIALKAQLDSANKAIENFRGTQKGLNDLIATRNALQDKYNSLLGETKIKADKLSVNDRNNLNSLEAVKDEAIAELQLEFEERKRQHELTVAEQVDYLQRLKAINDEYNIKKIDSIKGNNAAERAERAKLELQMVKDAIETNDQIRAIYKKAFDEQASLLKKQFENITAKVKLDVEVVQQNPDATNEAKAIAEQQGNTALLQAANDYYTKLEVMAKFYGQKTNEIEQERMKAYADIQRKGLDDAQNIIEAKLKDIEVAYDKASSSITSKFDNLRLAILGNVKKSSDEKTFAVDEIDKLEKVQQATAKLQIAQQAYRDIVLQPVRTDGRGAVNNEIADNLHHAVEVAMKELDDAIKEGKPKIDTLKDLFSNQLAKLFDININTERGKAQYALLAETIKETFDVAGNAMNAYFDAESNRINQSRDLQLKKLDIEEAQVKARAQSQAEEASIDKQFQEKRDAANKEAFEKQKKVQIAQAEINLATQLSNLAVIAFAPNPLNIATLGTAGAVMYAIQAALAFVNFATNVSRIKSAQFAYGGNPDTTTTRGGRVKGRPHSEGGNPFVFKGRVFEDEVDELNIIRTKNVNRTQRYTVTGTQSQIASALNVAGGGKPFESGATIKRFEMGGNVTLKRFELGGGISLAKYSTAPVFTPANNNTTVNNQNGISKEDMNNILNEFRNIALEQSNRIDRLSVHLDTDRLDDAQKKRDKQKQIRTL